MGKKSCIITGYSSLTGKTLLKSINFEEWKVYLLGRKNLEEVESNKTTFIECDLGYEWDVGILPKNIDCVVYIANSNNYKEFPEKSNDIFNINIKSVFKLLEYGRRVEIKNFVYISTGSVYQQSLNSLKEEDELDFMGKSFYKNTKLNAEILCNSYKQFFNIVILRPFYIYGIGQKKHTLIENLITNIEYNKEIYINGENGIKINPIYVTDVACAIYKAMYLTKTCTINLAGNRVLGIKEICDVIGVYLGKRVNYVLKEKELNLIGDITKMKEILYVPKVRFDEGIRGILDYKNK